MSRSDVTAIIMPILHGKSATVRTLGHPFYDVDDAHDPVTKAELKRLRCLGDCTAHNAILKPQIEAWARTLSPGAVILGHHPHTLPSWVRVLGAVKLLDEAEIRWRHARRGDGDEIFILALQNVRDIGVLGLPTVRHPLNCEGGV